MADRRPPIPDIFFGDFTVDPSSPFQRHLNRLEVEVGGEDYAPLKDVELLSNTPSPLRFDSLEEITDRLLETTQNGYNRDLLRRLGIRVYLDPLRYAVYYRLADRTVRFTAAWRQEVLRRFFGEPPLGDTGWRKSPLLLPGFQARYLSDNSGGLLYLRREDDIRQDLPLLTSTHGPYDPHTSEVTLHLLRTERGGGALINLGFSGREPLSDQNLEKLKKWGIPLNPSNVDVIYPYVDGEGHPFCYKLEEKLNDHVEMLGRPLPQLIIDIHGCVGTRPGDERLVVGLGGFPPYPRPRDLGEVEERNGRVFLSPGAPLRRGLDLLRSLSPEIYVQFCSDPHLGFNLRLTREMNLEGKRLDPRSDVASLVRGETRTWLPAEEIRWLPGAGGNALQRLQASRIRPDALCLHAEIPTAVRRRIATRLG